MAIPTLDEQQFIAEFGPSLHYEPADGWSSQEPNKLVKTHCCFCGIQCGIQLKVKDDKVVGFEPWEEFPVNRGMLCPKGVKRYMQNDHPDRLLSPLIRDNAGFREAAWGEAMERLVGEIRRIQAQHGPDSFAILGGASMTNEKAYLLGKLARVAVKTANIDYNGRLCMVSAGAANKIAFGVDRSANPWSDIPLAKALVISGANVGECFPILTDYIWRARDNGGKIIVIDPRMTPIARTADLFLPVRPGRDSALANGILHVMIQRGWIDPEFIEAHTEGFDQVQEIVRNFTPVVTEKITGVPASSILKAAEIWGTAETSMLLHARGVEHHTKGVENCLSYINLVLASGRIGKPGCGYGTLTGQGNGQGGREHGQRCNQLPGGRDIENPEHRQFIADFWKVPEPEIPHTGLTACEIIDSIESGEIKGLLAISFNPLVSIPDAEPNARGLGKNWSTSRALTSSSPKRPAMPMSCLPDRFRRRTRALSPREKGAVSGCDSPCRRRAMPAWTGRFWSTWRAGWDTANFFLTPSPRTSFVNCAPLPRAGTWTTVEWNTPESKRIWAFSGPVHPGTIRARRGCSKAAGSTIPTARHGSGDSNTGLQPKTSM